ncbi:LuxR family transcriptional regulator [Aureimonas endophytica]|uniref:LuxR family transcriptional regulator n=1 Tax=Aureimonas endophytica TaxID=2027858 RepID=A0A917E394_9HYPH|nr:helix-turn-helix transcriptional regulator [Aureimonas endophytica]GGD96660.1 LuxR family transcriptional regulator [Aureimonas endophytica]
MARMIPARDDIIDAIYEASQHSAPWDRAIGLVQDSLRAQTGSLYVQNIRDLTGRTDSLESAILLGYGTKAIADYGDYYHRINPFSVHAEHFPIGRIGRDTDLDAIGKLPRFEAGEYYADWVKPQGLRHVIGQFLRPAGEGLLCFCFWREAGAGAFDAADSAAFETLTRHIGRAVAVGKRLATAQAEVQAILTQHAEAVMTIGADGRLRQANALADRLLQLEVGLKVRGGRLRTAMPQDQAALDRLLACALDPRFAAWAEHAAVPIHRADGRPPLTARTIAVAHRFDPFAPDRAASVILTIEGFEAETEAVEARLRRRFGLSAAQGRVAMQLREGRSPAEAAQALGLSVETVRSHLRVLFQRTGTRRQAELVVSLRQAMG